MSSSSIPFLKIFARSQEYLELEKGDDENSEQAPLDTSSRRYTTYRRQYIFSVFINAILSVMLVLTFMLSNSGQERSKDDKELIRATSSVSPVLEQIPLSLSLITVNGSFMSETNPPDIFRALPSPDVDTAWRAIGKPTWITIDATEAESLGKDPSVLVRAPSDWGHGPDRYIAMLDLNHQLHCVDQLRRAAFRDEYPIDIDGPRGAFIREHWMHCVHILYQNVMCTGSMEVITYNWRETQHFPVPDFDVDKVCRNSEALVDFQEREKILDMDAKRDKMVKPDSAVVLPLPPRLKAFLEALDDE